MARRDAILHNRARHKKKPAATSTVGISKEPGEGGEGRRWEGEGEKGKGGRGTGEGGEGGRPAQQTEGWLWVRPSSS